MSLARFARNMPTRTDLPDRTPQISRLTAPLRATSLLSMASKAALRDELEVVRALKTQAQNRCFADAKTYQRRKDPAAEDALEPEDKLNWTAEQWNRRKPAREATEPGFKNLTDLATATYEKNLAGRTVDMDAYQRAQREGSGNAAQDDIDALSKLLQDAQARRLNNRRLGGDGSLYINEKNRQFNMKLDRDYGK